MIRHPHVKAEIRALARRYHREMLAERSLDMEAQILQIIHDMLTSPLTPRLTVKEITSWFVDRYGEDYERKITTKWIGSILRKRLTLRTQKSHGVFVIPPSEEPKLARLFEKYGVEATGNAAADAENPAAYEDPVRVDVGEVGDIEQGERAPGLLDKPTL
jgi:hypothetical protein